MRAEWRGVTDPEGEGDVVMVIVRVKQPAATSSLESCDAEASPACKHLAHATRGLLGLGLELGLARVRVRGR